MTWLKTNRSQENVEALQLQLVVDILCDLFVLDGIAYEHVRHIFLPLSQNLTNRKWFDNLKMPDLVISRTVSANYLISFDATDSRKLDEIDEVFPQACLFFWSRIARFEPFL